MESQEFKEQNLVLKAGDNPNTHDLNACRCTDKETKMPFIFAKFKMSEEEVKRVVETGELWVGVMGNGWPPLLPTVYNPFDELTFDANNIGLPVMKYREETEAMLRKVWFDEDIMSEKWWNEFLYYMTQKFDFREFGEKLERGKNNGFSIDSQLIECERIMLNIMSKDQAIDLAKRAN